MIIDFYFNKDKFREAERIEAYSKFTNNMCSAKHHFREKQV
jgi:hypothetical protein